MCSKYLTIYLYEIDQSIIPHKTNTSLQLYPDLIDQINWADGIDQFTSLVKPTDDATMRNGEYILWRDFKTNTLIFFLNLCFDFHLNAGTPFTHESKLKNEIFKTSPWIYIKRSATIADDRFFSTSYFTHSNQAAERARKFFFSPRIFMNGFLFVDRVNEYANIGRLSTCCCGGFLFFLGFDLCY